MTLFLIGYMGSGKSVVGKKLAEVLKYNYLDFDDYISDKEQSTISELFSVKGEIYFRKAEFKYLKDLMQLKNTVVALGGGTPCYGKNMQSLINAPQSCVIYLKTSIPHLTDRLFEERQHRPLIAHIASKEALLEFIGKHLFERAPYYERADIAVTTDNKSLSEITEEILLKLY